MASVDTNVLVRLLTRDDAVQSGQARHLMARVERAGKTICVALTVILELEWVLRSQYEYSKDQVLTALSSLLESREFDFQGEAAVENAFDTFRRNRVDFAECLHLACVSAAAQLPFITFDRVAAKLRGAQLAA